MKYPNVNPGSLFAVHDPSLCSPTSSAGAAPPTVALLTMADARAAANDDEAATQNPIRNPLWIIAIGMACFFGVMAALMSFG